MPVSHQIIPSIDGPIVSVALRANIINQNSQLNFIPPQNIASKGFLNLTKGQKQTLRKTVLGGSTTIIGALTVPEGIPAILAGTSIFSRRANS